MQSQSAMTASSTRPAAVVASAAGCVSKQQNLSIPILITHYPLRLVAPAPLTREQFGVRPLAHHHVVCLGKQLHQLISQLASTHLIPAANTDPRPRTSTRRHLLAADQHDDSGDELAHTNPPTRCLA